MIWNQRPKAHILLSKVYCICNSKVYKLNVYSKVLYAHPMHAALLHTLSFETPISPFSLVSMLVQERNSMPNSSREDQSLMNQHLASATVTPSRLECCAMICLEMAFTLHLGGAMRPLMLVRNSGPYLQKL